MVTKSKKANSSKKRKVKVLSLTKETVKDLSGGERKRVKGGAIATLNSCQGIKSGIEIGTTGVNSLSAGHTYFNVSAGNSTIGF